MADCHPRWNQLCLHKQEFLTVLEAGNVRLKCQQGWCLLSPLFGLQMAAFSLCCHMTFSLSIHTHLMYLSLLRRSTQILGLSFTLTTLFNFNYILKSPIYKCSYILRHWGSSLRHYEFCTEGTIQPIIVV